MTQVEIVDAARAGDVGYKVDVGRGERISRVSSEWFSRAADERYLSLSDLYAAVRGRTERSRTRTVESAAIRVKASSDDAETRFANSSPTPFINGVKAARERIVARNDDDRNEFLRKRGFSKAETAKIIETVLTEEGRKPESVFDFVQGITAIARCKTHQDARLDLEARAKQLFERAA